VPRLAYPDTSADITTIDLTDSLVDCLYLEEDPTSRPSPKEFRLVGEQLVVSSHANQLEITTVRENEDKLLLREAHNEEEARKLLIQKALDCYGLLLAVNKLFLEVVREKEEEMKRVLALHKAQCLDVTAGFCNCCGKRLDGDVYVLVKCGAVSFHATKHVITC
jgi:hypothetical protein